MKRRITKEPYQDWRVRMNEALRTAVTAQDIADIMNALIESAKKGDKEAARMVLDRTYGKVPDHSKKPTIEDNRSIAMSFTNLSERELMNMVGQNKMLTSDNVYIKTNGYNTPDEEE